MMNTSYFDQFNDDEGWLNSQVFSFQIFLASATIIFSLFTLLYCGMILLCKGSEELMEKALEKDPFISKLVRKAFPILTEGKTEQETILFNYQVPASFIVLQSNMIQYVVMTAMMVFLQELVTSTSSKQERVINISLIMNDTEDVLYNNVTTNYKHVISALNLSDAFESGFAIFGLHYTITGLALMYGKLLILQMKQKMAGKKGKAAAYTFHAITVLVSLVYYYDVVVSIFSKYLVVQISDYLIELIKDCNYLLIILVELTSVLIIKWWQFKEVQNDNNGSEVDSPPSVTIIQVDEEGEKNPTNKV